MAFLPAIWRMTLSISVGLCALCGASGVAASDAGLSSYLPMRKAVSAPEGFASLCSRYQWVCARLGDSAAVAPDEMAVARDVNQSVNHATRQISDQNQYGTAEYWALPTTEGGDCEDIALLKKMLLTQRGIAPDHLLLATVLDRDSAPHAVLVLRTTTGDFVLDNLTNRVKPWRDTGYGFLRMQNPDAPDEWAAVLAGGAFG